jgi:hypothetical protein
MIMIAADLSDVRPAWNPLQVPNHRDEHPPVALMGQRWSMPPELPPAHAK